MSQFTYVSDENKKPFSQRFYALVLILLDCPMEDAIKMWRLIDIRKCFNKGKACVNKQSVKNELYLHSLPFRYLVQLREGELALYCIGLGGQNKNADPITNTINLSSGNVSVSKENGCSTFSVQTKEHNYL